MIRMVGIYASGVSVVSRVECKERRATNTVVVYMQWKGATNADSTAAQSNGPNKRKYIHLFAMAPKDRK